MHAMFAFARAFHQDISGWNTARATNMYVMFGTLAFNQDISGWDTASVTNMHAMFSRAARATAFNQNLCAWHDRVPYDNCASSMSALLAAQSKLHQLTTAVPFVHQIVM